MFVVGGGLGLFFAQKFLHHVFSFNNFSNQAEVLRDVVAKIEVQKEGVLVKIFVLSGGNLAKK